MKLQVHMQKQNERIENLEKLYYQEEFREVFKNGTKCIPGKQELIYEKVR